MTRYMPFYNSTISLSLLFSPAGSKLVEELDSSQPRVVQPAAGFSVVTVGAARQLPTSPDIPTRAKRQVAPSFIHSEQSCDSCLLHSKPTL